MIGKSIGRYRIVDQLGRGPQGVVYRAVDDSLGRGVAIRRLSPHLRNEENLKRFHDEAIAIAELKQREIATIYDLVHADGEVLMVTELIRGESLDQLSKRSGPLPPERAAYLVWQVLGGLAAAHKAGLVHRDIKPSNVIVTDGGAIKIIDFGLARIAEPDGAVESRDARATMYMAPEQLLSKPIDSRADLYACGVLFYSLLTGMPPFAATDPVELTQKQLLEPPTPAADYLPDIDAWCQPILNRALAKQPIDRFQTAEEFREALMNAIGSTAGTSPAEVFSSAVFEGAPTVVLPPHARPPANVAAAPSAHDSAGMATTAELPRVLGNSAPPAPAPPPSKPAQTERRRSGLQPIHVLIPLVAIGLIAAGGFAYVIVNDNQWGAATPAADTTAAAAPAEPPAPEPATAPPPTDDAPAAAPRESGTGGVTATPSLPESPEPRPAEAAPAVASRSTNASKPVEAPPPPAPLVMFDGDAVVADGGRHRERDARIVVGDGKVTIMERNDTVITSLPVDSITSLNYSTARQPLWLSPDGPAEVLKVEGGAFGIRRGGRNWIALRTTDGVHVIRVRDQDIRSVIGALQTHTGRPVVRVVEKRN